MEEQRPNIRLRFIAYIILTLLWGLYFYVLLTGPFLQYTNIPFGLDLNQVTQIALSGFFFTVVIWVLSIAGAMAMFQFSKRIADSDMKNGFARISKGLLWLSSWLPTAVLLMFIFSRFPNADFLYADFILILLYLLHTVLPLIGLAMIVSGELNIVRGTNQFVWIGKRDTHLAELEEQQQRFLAQQARNEIVLQSIGEGLVVTDEERKITFINEAGCDVLGCKPKKAVGETWPEFVKPRTKKKEPMNFYDTSILQAMKTGKQAQTEGYYEAVHGELIPMVATTTPIMHGKKREGFVTVFHNMKEEFMIENAKRDFITIAAHQLRSPLSSIRWTAELLLGGEIGPLTEKQKEQLRQIKISSASMSDMINDFLEISNIDMGTLQLLREPVNLVRKTRDVLKEFSPLIQDKKHKIKTDFPEELSNAQLDPNLIEVAIHNLISNALKFTPKDGRITISIKEKEGDIYFSIEDNGYGIPKEEQQHLFKKFFRASNIKERVIEGTGLGLYLTQAVVERHEGKIWFESKEGKGSTFHFRVPKGKRLA